MTVPPGGWRSEAYRTLSTRADKVVGSTAKVLMKLHVETVGDLLRLMPRRYYTGTEYSDLSRLCVGDEVAVLARVAVAKTVEGRGPDPRSRRDRLEVVLTDGQARVPATFFGKPHLVQYWSSQLPVGARGVFCAKVGTFRDEPQLTHPDFVVLDADGNIIGGAERNHSMGRMARSGLVGIYPATGKLRTWDVAECAQLALDFVGQLNDPWPAWVREAAGVVELGAAFEAVHRPQSLQQVAGGQRRLRFDEAFAVQLAMARRRHDSARSRALPLRRVEGQLYDTFAARLPFVLTEGQQRVTAEIVEELAHDHPMQRLLQGEVGSGKTMVALLAMLAAVDAGAQAVLIAPTEVLAAQHYRTITDLLGDLGSGGTLTAADHATSVRLLTGSVSAQARREIVLDVASGQVGLVIGTHAVLSTDVQFANLGLVVVDEQHRFGVEQRAALNDRAEHRPHVLVMTATPIPRTVAMTVFGDLRVSSLSEIPAGRSDVATFVVENGNAAWVERTWQRAVEEVGEGRQVFVVCPRITADTKAKTAGDAGAAVTDVYDYLSSGPLRQLRVGIMHGQLSAEDKDDVMGRFVAGELDVLVSTTVIEVGVDVPNASMMIVMDAERFGISQLHQLRGRIGRGRHPGVCLLMTKEHASTEFFSNPTRDRLDAVAATCDGFVLADVDLQQRREGDVLGAAQAGARSRLRLLSVIDHADIIEQAHELAERAIVDDPDLVTPGFADAVAQIDVLAGEEWADA